MVWLSKREVAYLLLLRKAFAKKFNLVEALDLLELFGSRRVARKVLKRLAAKGFLQRLGSVEYGIDDLENALWKLLLDYLAQRLQRNLRSRGLDVVVYRDRESDRLVVEGCIDAEFTEVLKRLGDLIELRCSR